MGHKDLPANPLCRDCRWWWGHKGMGHCRFNAPVVNQARQFDSNSGWPATYGDFDWCGEFEVRPPPPPSADAVSNERLVTCDGA